MSSRLSIKFDDVEPSSPLMHRAKEDKIVKMEPQTKRRKIDSSIDESSHAKDHHDIDHDSNQERQNEEDSNASQTLLKPTGNRFAASNAEVRDKEMDDDDDVIVVEPPAIGLVPVHARAASGFNSSNSNSNNNNKDDEVEIVGCTNQVRLPHLRQHCTEKPFLPLSHFRFKGESRYIPPWAMISIDGNIETCDLCYCYICDKPARECERWSSDEFSTAYHNHCHATDKGRRAEEWNEIRQLYKNQDLEKLRKLEKVEVANSKVQKVADYTISSLPATIRVGAFPPTEHRASPFFNHLTKCRKCGWYSFVRTVDEGYETPVRICPSAWCHACGRIATDKCLDVKSLCQPYVPKPKDIYIGTKTIPFRIKVHDPRKMKMFRNNWARFEGSSPEWTYDEAEAEDDMFRHRFSKYPSLGTILLSIPVLREDKLPTDATLDDWSLSRVTTEIARTRRWENICSYETNEEDNDADNLPPDLRAEDTDAVLVEKINIVVLQELLKFGAVGCPPDTMPRGSIAGDIVATWNREERRGEFVVRIFYRHNDRFAINLGPLLASWFDVPPFPLSSLVRTMKASTDFGKRPHRLTPFPPWNVTEKEYETLANSATKDEMIEAVTVFNNQIELSNAKTSLWSSAGDKSPLGGICSSDTSLEGLLQRYFTEMFLDDVESVHDNPELSWLGRAAGITSYHRRCCSNMQYVHTPDRRPVSLESYVREDDIPLVCINLPAECFVAMQSNNKSISGVLVHLEDLGHEEAPFVEGLNVELLPFQRQTLQWALERETTPGGLQSFISSKLPFSENLYYHAVSESIRDAKPALVRGGIIADEMGLGKTVVSLALILQNQAPLDPISGTLSQNLNSDSMAVSETGWNCDWQLEEGHNPLKASIVSRGTLVVCHVSLVSQWIDEAKSKLNDPGLVYAYHGQNRKRDAMILARNSIIVTTYATLAKDTTYHAGKAFKNGDCGYCPPCEQIRWWRIICDESHTLKQDTLQTKAVMNLVGDHKWAVSGTPWNTSFMDVKNQLKFVGLEDVDDMFREFQKTAFEPVNKRQRNSWHKPKLGHFLFLMRAVMIRHAHNHQYRGTSTTLMSLPPKTERTIMIDFEPDEAKEYEKLEKETLDFYSAFRRVNFKKLSKHYLKLIQRLMPLRIACAGGKVPLVANDEKADGEQSEGGVAIAKKRRRGRIPRNVESGGCDNVDVKKAATPKEKKVQLFSEFRFQSKFHVLIEELERIRDNEPDSKSLVFSQYASSLKFLQEELPQHDFQFRTLTGDMTLKQRAEALHAFQHDPPTTVFLLSMRSGAVGINLTQANRVFLLEPAMNPSLEAQAIGRVHRLGQKRNVEIVRLFMKASIDTRISQLVEKKYAPVKDVKKDAPQQAVARANAPIVGCMRTDKASLLGAEFDFLFGLEKTLNPAAAQLWGNDGAGTTNKDDRGTDHDDSAIDEEGSHFSDDDNFNDDDLGAYVPDCVKSESAHFPDCDKSER